ncbi:hypothetical protein [Vulgatibacter incomptus]|uniref:hypothetical protein n=1 Tax=Vulgatibacter incomptus TaxID=1391653 RepID=UPI000681D3BB|nr:hypothetical protein [Vulgatibacter incomptus]
MAVFLLAFVGCGEFDGSGAGEPIRVAGAQFVKGELPGLPAGEDAPGLPEVTSFDLVNPTVLPGQARKGMQGRVTATASAVAVRMEGMGSGYWLVPAGAPDPQYPGELGWSMSADFALEIPAGAHVLQAVAIDEQGRAGARHEQNICVASRIPDNLHACNPDRAPPDAVVVLRWNVDADLDLEVLTPTGRLVTPKSPLVEPVPPGERPSDTAAAIDRDSLSSCMPDGIRQENLIFWKRPQHGTRFRFFANLFDSCGQSGVAFNLTVYEAVGEGGERHLEPTFTQSGTLRSFDETGVAGKGRLLVDYPF